MHMKLENIGYSCTWLKLPRGLILSIMAAAVISCGLQSSDGNNRNESSPDTRNSEEVVYTGGSNDSNSDNSEEDSDNSAEPEVSTLTRVDIVDADDLSIIQTLSEDTTIDLDRLPSKVNFTATSTNINTTGSVDFSISGCAALERHENNAPYTLAEESKGLSDLSVGDCSITATPYSQPNKIGVVGQPLVVNMRVVDTSSLDPEPAEPITPPISSNQCNDGIDNDGDGLVDWQYDVGCWGPGDNTEGSGDRTDENGWTTFDLNADSRIVYVSSSEGSDGDGGSTPSTAVRTIERGSELVRDGFPDFLLLKRGDVWRDAGLGRFKSGRSAEQPLVISSYGDSMDRPRIEMDTWFVNDNGHARQYLAVIGLELVAYQKDPQNAAFNGGSGSAGIRYVASSTPSRSLLFEDISMKYAEFIIQDAIGVELRRNSIYKSYHSDTCAYTSDGTPNLNGNARYRPSGIFAGSNDGLLLEGNFFDGNGWNPDVASACATIYNHNMYLADNKNVVVKDNISLRPSSIGLKFTANNGVHSSEDLLIENNLFVDGEIGISIGGNKTTAHRFGDAVIKDNVFTDIGRNPPTKRELSWYIEVLDNDNTEIANNLFLNSPSFGNTYAISLTGGSNRDISINNNYFDGIYKRNIRFQENTSWSDISINVNTFVGRSDQCLLDHQGGFNTVNYSNNRYQSEAAADSWFCHGGVKSLSEWLSDAGESGAAEANHSASAPGRNLESYVTTLGLGSLDSYSQAIREQSRLNYDDRLMAGSVNEFIRAGYQ